MCEGEILPAEEDCSEPEDEDCSGHACGETMWVRQFGAPSTVVSNRDVAVDPRTEEIYLAGDFRGQFTMGQDTLDSQGEAPVAFLAKFDRLGTPLWAKQFGKINGSILDETTAGSVAVDGQGNVVLVGRTASMLNIGGDDLPEGLFIGKFSPSGRHIWSQSCQSDFIVEVATIRGRGALDPVSNDIIIAGNFNNSVEGMKCGDVTLMSTSMGGHDIFVSRFASADGSVMLLERFGGSGSDFMDDVVVDDQGSILITGRAGSALSFGGSPVPPNDGYVAKLASNASHVWSRGIGSGQPLALALDADGGVAMTGSGDNTGVLNFGGDNLAPIGNDSELFVARLDTSGAHVWSKRFGSPGDNTSIGMDLTLDSGGNLAVSGYIFGNVPIDGIILAGNADAFVARFDTNGTSAWSKTFGESGKYSLTFSPRDELVAGGQAFAPVDFGQGVLTPIGDTDLFLLEISP